MNRQLIQLFALFFLLSFSPAKAQESSASTKSESKIKVEDVTETNIAPGDDVDQVITNKKMRAESGSKSRLSISNSITYLGGTVERPLAEDRPNVSAGTASTDFASLSDSLAAKIAIDQRHAILAGLGVRWITPFQSSEVPKTYPGTKVDAEDPYVHYLYVYKMAGIQNVFTVGPTVITENNLVRAGYVGNVVAQQDSNYEFGSTGLSIGVLTGIIGTAYNSSDPQIMAFQSDYSFIVWPFLEYVINDRLNFRTVVGMWGYEHLRNEPRALSFYKDNIYQSIGLGISITRDIFLFPNIQFSPEDIRADRTNVGLAANVNLF